MSEAPAPNGTSDASNASWTETTTSPALDGLAEEAFLANSDSRYLGPVTFGKGNLQIENVIIRLDSNDHVTATMDAHWGKMKTIERRGGLVKGPYIQVTLLDRSGVPVGQAWNLGQINQVCSNSLRWRFTQENDISGAFDKAIYFEISHTSFEWWYC